MPARPRPVCPLAECRKRRAPVRTHARRRTRRGARTRYQCGHCGRTFTAVTGTPYERLRYPPDLFDQVVRMSVEGMAVASISRSTGISPSTVRRWLKVAAKHAARFNHVMIRNIDEGEIQFDELKTFAQSKARDAWLYTSIGVSARLWVTLLVGSQSKRDTRRHLRDLRDRLQFCAPRPLLSSDAHPYYEPEVRKVFGPACIYVQIEKRYSRGRVAHSKKRLVLGSPADLEDALARSEDSNVPNTAFVERLNLTIRHMIAALHRRTAAFARCRERLAEALELARCCYNFLRPHSALRFGNETRTPAMQAGLVSRRLTFRDVFLSSSPGPGRVSRETTALRGGLGVAWPCRIREEVGFRHVRAA